MRETVYKLSLLRDDVLLISEDGLLLNVGDLNKSLSSEEGIEIQDNWYSLNQLKKSKWYIVRKDTWSIDARRMIEREIEDSTTTETAPGWRSRALEAMEDIDFDAIKKAVMEVLVKAEGVSEFYEKVERVEINS
jgi:hypothetical protein